VVAASAAEDRPRLILWLPVAFGAGIALYFSLDHEPAAWPAAVVLFLAATIALLRWPRTEALATVAVAVAAAGFLIVQFHAASVAAPVLDRRLGAVDVGGRVLEVEARQEGVRLLLDRVTIADLPPGRTPERIRLGVRRLADPIHPGDYIVVRAALMPPPGPALPGGHDFARAAWFERIGAVGYALGRPTVDPPADEGRSYAIWLAELRRATTARIRAGIDDPGAGAVAAALVTGDRAAIPADVNAAMRDSGLAHLLSISGLHLSLVAGIVLVALRVLLAAIPFVALRFPIKKWAAIGALAASFAYLEVSGASVPAQRAFVMIAIVLLAVLIDRTALSMRSVGLAALVVLVIAPESLVSASFQLSFAAVIGLIAAFEALRPHLATLHRDASLARRIGL